MGLHVEQRWLLVDICKAKRWAAGQPRVLRSKAPLPG